MSFAILNNEMGFKIHDLEMKTTIPNAILENLLITIYYQKMESTKKMEIA